MAKNLFAKMKRDWTRLGTNTEVAFEQYARKRIRPDLELIDDEFEIKFPFRVVKKKNNTTGNLTVTVEIPETATFIRETDGEEVYAASLFTWLDKGISVSHVRLVIDEETGEEKAIASKRNFTYHNPYPPKNWTVNLAAKHQAKLPSLMRVVINKFLSGGK